MGFWTQLSRSRLLCLNHGSRQPNDMFICSVVTVHQWATIYRRKNVDLCLFQLVKTVHLLKCERHLWLRCDRTVNTCQYLRPFLSMLTCLTFLNMNRKKVVALLIVLATSTAVWLQGWKIINEKSQRVERNFFQMPFLEECFLILFFPQWLKVLWEFFFYGNVVFWIWTRK